MQRTRKTDSGWKEGFSYWFFWCATSLCCARLELVSESWLVEGSSGIAYCWKHSFVPARDVSDACIESRSIETRMFVSSSKQEIRSGLFAFDRRTSLVNCPGLDLLTIWETGSRTPVFDAESVVPSLFRDFIHKSMERALYSVNWHVPDAFTVAAVSVAEVDPSVDTGIISPLLTISIHSHLLVSIKVSYQAIPAAIKLAPTI
jgi:hypothetical protein